MARLGAFGGPLALAGILLLTTDSGRKALKKLSREATRVGVKVYDKVKEIADEAREEATQLIEEAKAERSHNGKGSKVAAKE